MKTGIELIAEERKEQIEKHGRTIENDIDINVHYQLNEGAIGLLWVDEEERSVAPPVGWDERIWNKMEGKPYEERLIIAGALIAAEIDRIKEPIKQGLKGAIQEASKSVRPPKCIRDGIVKCNK